ncbi:hypothetical protein A3Q56_01099 [Intoshia linei]|uniref:t-SNARE coiled-coil homology domain-containing protein n=1 Tax=Intoshia linei TaxID=1819745 RepID=A0A177BBX8_9BILA|nr:hypothetical protein A3Q56_01099 [Intoshia linei]
MSQARDRLKEFKKKAVIDTNDLTIDVENGSDEINFFLTRIRNQKNELDQIQQSILHIKKMQTKILSNPALDNKTKDELENLMREAKKLFNNIRKEIKETTKIVTDEEKSTNDKYIASVRIKRTQLNALLRQFTEITNEFYTSESDYKDRYKQKLNDQLAITGKNLRPEEIDQLIDKGEASIFTEGIIANTKGAIESVKEIENTHAEILKIAKNLEQIHEMFQDMNNLIVEQGIEVDNIEHNIIVTQDYVEKANVDIEKAVTSKGKTRKNKCILLVIGIVILVIIIISVSVSFAT